MSSYAMLSITKLASARKFTAVKHWIFVDLWGMIMNGLYDKKKNEWRVVFIFVVLFPAIFVSPNGINNCVIVLLKCYFHFNICYTVTKAALKYITIYQILL